MRTFCFAFAVLGAVPASAVHAQSVPLTDRQLQVLGTAPTGCLLGTLSAQNPANMNFAVNSTSSGTVGITQFVDLQTLRTLPSSIDLILPITCNASHRIAVRSANGGLMRSGAASPRATLGGFGQFVAYTYRVDWLGRAYDRASNTGSLAIAGDNAGQGNLTLRVANPGGRGPLAAGRYNDTITIEVLAAE